jgi:hypothetical protein
MYTMRENEIARRVGEGVANEFAEGHKDGAARLLVMWHASPIFVFAAEGRKVGHDLLKTRTMPLSVTAEHAERLLSRVERTLLSAAFDLDFAGLGKSKSTPRSTAADRSVRPTPTPSAARHSR